MSTPHEQYQELIALTELHLLEEYSPQELITVDPDAVKFLQTQKPASVTKPIPAPKAIEVVQQPLKQETTKSPPFPKKEEPPAPQPTQTAISKPFELDTSHKPIQTEFEDIKQLIKEKAPHFAISDHIPPPAAPKTLQLIFLTSNEEAEDLQFLENVLKAAQGRGLNARILMCRQIEKENKWDKLLTINDLRLIVLSKQSLLDIPALGIFNSENGYQKGPIQAFVYDNLSAQKSDISFKQELWKKIQSI